MQQLEVEEVKSIIKSLAMSQGFYGRLKADLDENDSWEYFTEILNENSCKDSVDIIMYLEG